MLEKMLLVDRASQLAKDQPRDGTALFSDILLLKIYDKTGLSGRGRLFFKANGERTAL